MAHTESSDDTVIPMTSSEMSDSDLLSIPGLFFYQGCACFIPRVLMSCFYLFAVTLHSLTFKPLFSSFWPGQIAFSVASPRTPVAAPRTPPILLEQARVLPAGMMNKSTTFQWSLNRGVESG